MRLISVLACCCISAISGQFLNSQAGQSLKASIASIKDKAGALDGVVNLPDYEIPCDAQCMEQLGQLESYLKAIKGNAEAMLNN